MTALRPQPPARRRSSWWSVVWTQIALTAVFVTAAWAIGARRGYGSAVGFVTVLVVGCIGAIWLERHLRRDTEEQADPSTCRGCGYDLAGLPTSAPCPECGQSPPAPRLK